MKFIPLLFLAACGPFYVQTASIQDLDRRDGDRIDRPLFDQHDAGDDHHGGSSDDNGSFSDSNSVEDNDDE